MKFLFRKVFFRDGHKKITTLMATLFRQVEVGAFRKTPQQVKVVFPFPPSEIEPKLPLQLTVQRTFRARPSDQTKVETINVPPQERQAPGD